MNVPPINLSIALEGQQGWGEARLRPGQRGMAAGAPATSLGRKEEAQYRFSFPPSVSSRRRCAPAPRD